MLTVNGQEIWPSSRLTRREIHHELGGQQQGGIATPRHHPVVLLFTGGQGTHFGYSDGWAEQGRVFRYFGEGQRGDMSWVRGNRAVRDHGVDGRELHLFEAVSGGAVSYLGQMDCGSWEFVDGVPDVDRSPRRAIVFNLVRHGVQETDGLATDPETDFWDQPLAHLRNLAMESPARGSDPKRATKNVFLRSRAVTEYVLRRSEGTCEGCRSSAPFVTKKGRPYLECHHTTRLSDGGPDHPAHVVAVCPNCHRRAHLGSDAEIFNGKLRALAEHLER